MVYQEAFCPRKRSERAGKQTVVRVLDFAPCHIGPVGCTEDGIPITGIDPALVSITRVFIPSPQSISRTPVRTTGDRTARNTTTGLRTTHTARSLDVPSMLTEESLLRDARFLRMPKTSGPKTSTTFSVQPLHTDGALPKGV
jgi:hypothetical protein